MAIGPAASAIAANGNDDSATALNGVAAAGYGNHDIALAAGDKAGALGGDYDSALQWGKDAFALAGDGNGNFADVMGAGSGDFTGGGFDGDNLAYAGGNTGVFANYNIASVLGIHNAVAGNDLLNAGTTAGDYDIATVFGTDNVTANATGADGQTTSPARRVMKPAVPPWRVRRHNQRCHSQRRRVRLTQRRHNQRRPPPYRTDNRSCPAQPTH